MDRWANQIIRGAIGIRESNVSSSISTGLQKIYSNVFRVMVSICTCICLYYMALLDVTTWNICPPQKFVLVIRIHAGQETSVGLRQKTDNVKPYGGRCRHFESFCSRQAASFYQYCRAKLHAFCVKARLGFGGTCRMYARKHCLGIRTYKLGISWKVLHSKEKIFRKRLTDMNTYIMLISTSFQELFQRHKCLWPFWIQRMYCSTILWT